MLVELNVNPWVQLAGNQLQFEEVTQSYQQNMFHKNSIGSLKVCNPEGVNHIVCVVSDKVQLALGASKVR